MKNFNSFFNQLTAMPKRLAMVLTVLFTVGVEQMWGAEEEVYSANFTTVSNHSYTQNKTFTLASKSWTSSVSQVASNVFYLGCNSNNASKGILANNRTFSEIVTALKSVDAKYSSTSNAHAYALLFDNAYDNVTKVNFAWSGGNNAFQVYLFGYTNSAWVSLSSTNYATSGTSIAGSVEWKGNATNYTKFAVVARPGATNSTATKKTLRASTFKIYTDNSAGTPETPEKTATSLEWSAATYTATIDGANTFPTLTTTPANLTGVTYSSSNTAAATINASTGAITLVAAGTTTITASYAGNETYEAAENATYTLTVEAAQGGGGSGDSECTWELVTDASTLKVDDEVIIAASNNDYAISTTQANNNRTATPITKDGTTLSNPSTSVQVLTLKEGTNNGTWALYTGSGYLYAAASGSNHLKTQQTNNVNGSWTITITNNIASIVATGSSNRNVMQFNPNNGSPIFACYASASQTSLALYKKVCSSGGDDPEPTKTLTSIEITTPATQTTFWQGETFNHNGLVVTAHYSDAEDEIITPTVTGSTATAGTATVTVSYKELSTSYAITVKAIPNTKETAYSVAEAFDIIDKLGETEGIYITGTISQVDSYNSTYKSITYWISADGTTTNQLQVYSGKGLESADFDAVADLTVGDKVIVCGKLKKYSGTYEFDKNNYLAEHTKTTKDPAGLAYATTSYTANVGEAFTTPELTNPHNLVVTYSTSDASKATVDANSGAVTIVAAGVVTITAATTGDASHDAGSASYNITITDPSLLIATLPFEFNGKQADIEGTAGMTHSGIDADDYKSAPYLKMNTTGDWLIICFDSEPEKLSYDIKNNSFSGGTFSVQESADGETYTDVKVHTEITETQSEEHTLLSTSRYVKFIYTEKVDGNVGLGNIKITEPDLRQEAGIAWSTESVEITVGEDFTPPTLSNPNGLTLTCTSNNEDLVTVTNAGVITLKESVTGTAIITATFAGNKDYKPAEVSCTITVNALYTVTLNPNYPEGKTGVFKDKEGNIINGNLEVLLPSGTATQALTNFYSSIELDNYAFDGFYTQAEGGSKRVNTGDITGNITFYAHWKEKYTITWSVNGNTALIEPTTFAAGDNTWEMPTTDYDCSGKGFVGWTTNPIIAAQDEAPDPLYTNASQFPNATATYHAVFAEGGSGGSGGYKKLTEALDDYSGEYLIVYETDKVAFNGGLTTLDATSNYISVTINDDVIVSNATTDAAKFTFAKVDGGYSILSASGRYIGRTADSNGLDESTSIAYTNTITITEGNADVVGSGNAHLRYNKDAGQTRFRYYKSSSYTSQQALALYKKSGSSASYTDYTTGCHDVTITYYGFKGGYTELCDGSDLNVITQRVNSSHTIPNCGNITDPTDLGRTFLNLWKDQNGKEHKPGDSFIVTQDITLYAQWKLETTGDIELPADKEDLATTDIVVTGGKTLTIPEGKTITINSLTLKGGLIGDGKSGNYAMPSVWVPEGAKLVRKNTTINLDLVVNSKSWYPFAVPFAATINANVEYLEPTLAAASEYGTHFAIKTYDGARRAEEGVDQTNNWVQLNRNEKLQPGVGYIISALTYLDKDTATIRIPMSVPNEWLANGELTTVNEVTRNQVAVTAYTGKASDSNNGGHQRHAGWNFVANPYLSMFAGGNVANDVEYIKGSINIQDKYTYEDTEVTYVTVPAYNFAYYEQFKLSATKLNPEYSFFVQVGTDGTMTFETAGRQQAPAHLAARAAEQPIKMDVDITLSDDNHSDQTGLIICDRFTDAYEIGHDLEKMFGSAYNLSVYTLMADNTPLAFQALAIQNSMQVIPVGYRTPAQGEYTFALNEATSDIELLNEQYEQLILVDYETGALTNMLNNEYTFYSDRTQSNNRFALYAVPRQNTTTDLPNTVGNEEVKKVIYNDHFYILRNGKVFNGAGQIVK